MSIKSQPVWFEYRLVDGAEHVRRLTGREPYKVPHITMGYSRLHYWPDETFLDVFHALAQRVEAGIIHEHRHERRHEVPWVHVTGVTAWTTANRRKPARPGARSWYSLALVSGDNPEMLPERDSALWTLAWREAEKLGHLLTGGGWFSGYNPHVTLGRHETEQEARNALSHDRAARYVESRERLHIASLDLCAKGGHRVPLWFPHY